MYSTVPAHCLCDLFVPYRFLATVGAEFVVAPFSDLPTSQLENIPRGANSIIGMQCTCYWEFPNLPTIFSTELEVELPFHSQHRARFCRHVPDESSMERI
jgi:hypothetical protein